jgi:hypothetical protein
LPARVTKDEQVEADIGVKDDARRWFRYHGQNFFGST